MTNKEAWVLFGETINCIDLIGYGETPRFNWSLSELKEACFIATRAIVKQIPRKYRGTYDDASCPRCFASFHELGEDFNWCPDCGQAIDWGDEE